MRWSRFFLWAIAATIVLMIAVVAGAYYFPYQMPPAEITIGCGTLLFLYLVVGLGCSVPLENGRAPRLMRSGIILGALALVAWCAGLMIANHGQNGTGETFFKIIIWPTTWACLMMLVGLVLMTRKASGWRMSLRRGTILLLILLAAHICLGITFYPDGDDWETRNAYEDITFRAGGVMALVTGAAIAMTFLSAWLGRGSAEPPQGAKRLPYWFHCPRCEEEQTSTTGSSHCRRCGLRIRVEMS